MNAGSDLGRVIVVVDLRGVDPDTITSRRFAEVQSERAPDGDVRRIDFGRVIVLDDAAELVTHDEVYAHIRDSHVDLSLLCLAVGQAGIDDPTLALRRPYQLRPPNAATLWIGDVYGIGWRMDSSQAHAVNLPGANGTPGPGDDLPYGLIEILRVPQIFDRVVELAAAMRDATASPGLRVIHRDIAPAIVADAQRSAIRQLTDPASRAVDLPAPAGRSAVSSPATQRPGSVTEVIRPGGQVDQLYQRCRRAAVDATMAVRRATGVAGLASAGDEGVLGRLREFADAVTELVEMITRILDWADPRTGFEAMHRDRLRDLGIELGRARRSASPQTIEALTELTLNAVDRCQPLPAVAEQLRDESDKLVPQGTGTYQERLQRICPPAAVSRLRTPPSLLPRDAPAGLLAVTFVICLLCGLWPKPLGLCGGLAALGTLLASARIRSRAAAFSPVPSRNALRFMLGQAVAAIAGAGAGVALSRSVKLPVHSGPAAIGIGVAIAGVAVAILAAVCWRALANRWSAALAVTRLAAIPESLRGLVAETARNEWQAAEERAAASDLARVMAGMVDDAAASLRSYASTLPGPMGTGQGVSRRLQHDQVAQELAMMDLAAAVGGTMERLVRMLGPGSAATVDNATVEREMTATLAAYRHHLETAGLHEPPPFDRVPERRAVLAGSLMERDVDLQELMRSGVKDERITQLCTPEQLTRLETEASSAKLIRFAPRAAQQLFDVTIDHGIITPDQRASSAWAQPVEWTAASPVAGVLRLVPLRAGAVQEVYAAAESEGSSGLTGGWWPPGNDREGASDA